MNRLIAGALCAGLGFAVPAAAQEQTDIDRLTRLVEAQAKEIENLKTRLGAMERQLVRQDDDEGGRATAAVPSPPAATSAVPSSPHGLGNAQPSDTRPVALDARLAQIEAAQRRSVFVDWSRGTPEFTSPDGNITFRPRGRIQVDFGRTEGAAVDARNMMATQARSLRLGIEGSLGRKQSYVLEGDFADNDVLIKSAYLAWTTGFFGQQAEFALGNRLNDRGIDGSSGTISAPFIERNVVAQGIIPVRGFFGLGAAARIYGDSWHLGLQVSGDDINNPGTESDNFTIGARTHWNPLRTENGVAHVGAWGFHEVLSENVTRPTRSIAIGGFYNDQLRIAPGTLPDPASGDGYGFELGYFYSSAWAYAEYGARRIETESGARTEQDAWAIASGWFLTGDTPPYLARGGIWSRPRVRHPITAGGIGAFELAVRFESLDYSDNPTAGKGDALTLGLNWYPNDFTRFQLNFIDWTINNPNASGQRIADDGRTIVGRAQIAF